MVAHSESRASMRPTDDQNSNSEVPEIPESRATINNFVSILASKYKNFCKWSRFFCFQLNRIPNAAVRNEFKSKMTQLDEKWSSINSRIATVSPSDNQVAALCKQMISSANDILKCEPGNINLIATGRELGDMAGKLNELKSADVASPINTFAKNILFTSLYINKQTNGNDSFQASLNSLIDTTDQLMVLLETGSYIVSTI